MRRRGFFSAACALKIARSRSSFVLFGRNKFKNCRLNQVFARKQAKIDDSLDCKFLWKNEQKRGCLSLFIFLLVEKKRKNLQALLSWSSLLQKHAETKKTHSLRFHFSTKNKQLHSVKFCFVEKHEKKNALDPFFSPKTRKSQKRCNVLGFERDACWWRTSTSIWQYLVLAVVPVSDSASIWPYQYLTVPSTSILRYRYLTSSASDNIISIWQYKYLTAQASDSTSICKYDCQNLAVPVSASASIWQNQVPFSSSTSTCFLPSIWTQIAQRGQTHRRM